jgi:hypothetical protein
LKFCEHLTLKPKQEVTIVFFDTSCWKCHKPQQLWTVEKNLATICNQEFYLMGSMWNNDDIDKNPKIYDAIKQFLQTEKGKDLKIGQLKERYSKTVNEKYLSHGCFYCDTIFGDWFLNTEKMYAQNDPNCIRFKSEIEFEKTIEVGQHWCYSDNGEFCE